MALGLQRHREHLLGGRDRPPYLRSGYSFATGTKTRIFMSVKPNSDAGQRAVHIRLRLLSVPRGATAGGRARSRWGLAGRAPAIGDTVSPYTQREPLRAATARHPMSPARNLVPADIVWS